MKYSELLVVCAFLIRKCNFVLCGRGKLETSDELFRLCAIICGNGAGKFWIMTVRRDMPWIGIPGEPGRVRSLASAPKISWPGCPHVLDAHVSWLCTLQRSQSAALQSCYTDTWGALSTVALCSVLALDFSVQLFSWHRGRWSADRMDTERHFSLFFTRHKSACGVLRLLVPETAWIQ